MKWRGLRALASFGFSVSSFLLGARAAHAATIVACVGDSITAGGWPAKLGALLGNGYTVNNYGVSGTTLLKNGDSPYWNTQQFTDSHTVGPNIVVIMLGTNDSKPQNWSHKAEFAGDYEALVDSYSALGSHPRIFLNLCPPAGTNGFGISGTIIENEVLPLVRQTAAKKGTGLIDIFDAFGGHNFDPSLYGSTADQVHPNDQGAQKIADTVYAAITAAPDAGVGDAAADASARIDAAAIGDATGGGGGGAGMAGSAGHVGSGGTTASGAGGAPEMGSGGAAAETAGSGGDAGGASAATSDDSGCSCNLATSAQVGGVWWSILLVAGATLRRRRA
jgi:lysophospholipase L1-like esterase